MNKYGIIFAFLCSLGLGISFGFQSCGSSSMQANSSDNGELDVLIIPDQPSLTNGNSSGGDNAGDDNGSFVFSLAQGDNVFFRSQDFSSSVLTTSRMLTKSYYTILENYIYEATTVNLTSDLPQSFCEDSAHPHCAHQKTFVCMGYGCFEGPSPVRCYWQKRLSEPEENSIYPELNDLRFLTRQVTQTDPFSSGCNSPLLSFHNETESLNISLANRSCVPDGDYYAQSETAVDVIQVFMSELEQIEDLTNSNGDPEFCNNYSLYSWDTTEFHYQSRSGLVAENQSYYYNIEYKNRVANMSWQKPGETENCANNVPIQPEDLNVLFPDSGFQYDIFRTNSAVSNLPLSEITFEDPIDGGSDWQFYLDRGSALSFSGGAVLNETQANALRDLLENTLPERAATFQRVNVECSPSNN